MSIYPKHVTEYILSGWGGYRCLVCDQGARTLLQIPHTPGCWMAQGCNTLAKLPPRPEWAIVGVCAESIEREG